MHCWLTLLAFNALQAIPTKEGIKTVLLAALLLPLRACQSQAKKGKTTPTVSLIVGDSMKWKKSYASHVVELHAQASELHRIAQQLQVRNTTDKKTKTVSRWDDGAQSSSILSGS